MTIEIPANQLMELSSMSAIEASVIDKIKTRAEFGLQKYGTTLERTDLSTEQWIIHLQEELMDAACYCQKLLLELHEQTKNI
jgi:hypothetical protein